MTPETKVKKRLKQVMKDAHELQGIKSKLIFNAGAAMGLPSVDCTGVIMGVAVAIELKRLDGAGELTPRQKLTLDEFAAAGGTTWVIDTEAAFDAFVQWLHSLEVQP